MTPAQIQAFMEWVEARIERALQDHERRDACMERWTEQAAREAVYASFGFNDNGTKPEEKPEGRGWEVVPHPVHGYLYAVRAKDGTYWTTPLGVGGEVVWRAAHRRTAAKKARDLNAYDL